MEGSFYWESTGKRPSFTNWLTGQPDDYNKTEDCTELFFGEPGKWNDLPCETRFGGIMAMCEKILPVQQRKSFAILHILTDFPRSDLLNLDKLQCDVILSKLSLGN